MMIPLGFMFKTLGLLVGHYGPKLAEFFFGLQHAPRMQMLLLAQHMSLAVTVSAFHTNPGFIAVNLKRSS